MLASCGGGAYPVRTSARHGFTYSAPAELTEADLDHTVNTLVRLWRKEHGVNPVTLRGVHVDVIDTREECGRIAGPNDAGTVRLCDGVTVHGRDYIGIVDHGCWAKMSLGHELVHYWLLEAYPGIGRSDDCGEAESYGGCTQRLHHLDRDHFYAPNSIEQLGKAIARHDGVCGTTDPRYNSEAGRRRAGIDPADP